MTKEEILAMKPGIELDNLVREEILKLPFRQWAGRPSTDISAAWQVWYAITKNEPEGWAIYSDTYEEVTVEHYPDNYGGVREESCGDFDVSGPFPEAICKAALLAKLE